MQRLFSKQSGIPLFLPVAFEYAAIGGRVICIGILEQEVPMHFHKTFIQKELSLIAAYQPLNPTQDTIYWHHTQQANRALLLESYCTKETQCKRYHHSSSGYSRSARFL